MISTAIAFPLKEWKIQRSYRFAVVLNLVSIALAVLTFFFLGKLFEESAPQAFAAHKGYFPFVLVGFALSNFLVTLLNGLVTTLREEQDRGTLEAILATPISDELAITGLSLWSGILALLNGVVYLALGVIYASIDVSLASVVKSGLIILLSGTTFFGLGAIASSFILYFKKGNPIAWLFSSLSILFGGVYFPVELFPESIANIAIYLPLSCAIDGLRLALLQNAPFSGIIWHVTLLSIYTVLLLPIAMVALRISFRQTRLKGGLSHQ